MIEIGPGVFETTNGFAFMDSDASVFFNGLKALREMDGGKNPHAKTEGAGSGISQSMMIRMEIRRHISSR